VGISSINGGFEHITMWAVSGAIFTLTLKMAHQKWQILSIFTSTGS
jgi:hypothetical protein